MANARKNPHMAAVTKPTAVLLTALSCGGFDVSNGGDTDFGRCGRPLAAFSTLDEALTWLRENMAQPAVSATTAKAPA